MQSIHQNNTSVWATHTRTRLKWEEIDKKKASGKT